MVGLLHRLLQLRQADELFDVTDTTANNDHVLSQVTNLLVIAVLLL